MYFLHNTQYPQKIDFQKDQKGNLNYFPNDILRRHNLTLNDLREIANGKAICQSFRNLIAEYIGIADYYRMKALRALESIFPALQPKYKLSLTLIYQLYLQVFEKIDPLKGQFTTMELNPTPDEIKSRIQFTLGDFAKDT